MSTPHETWWLRAHQLVEARSSKDYRFRKLRGVEARSAVVNNSTARLLTQGTLVKMKSREGFGVRYKIQPGNPLDALTKPQRKAMLRAPVTIGNVTLQPSPVNGERWQKYVQLYKQLGPVLSPMWDLKGAELDGLIDRAINTERCRYIRETEESGGPTASENLEPSAIDRLGRHTEFGDARAYEPTRLIEIERQERMEAAKFDERELELEAVFLKMKESLNAYGNHLTTKQRKALKMICDGGKTGIEISEACALSPASVSTTRAWFNELSSRFFTLYDKLYADQAASAESTELGFEADGGIEQITDAAEFDYSTLGADLKVRKNKGGLAEAEHLANMSQQFSAPDVDGEMVEGNFNGYARSIATACGGGRDTGKKGGKPISEKTMSRGYEKFGHNTLRGSNGEVLKDAVFLVRRRLHQKATGKLNRNFADTALRYLRRKAKESGHDLDEALRIIDERIADERIADKTQGVNIGAATALRTKRRIEVLQKEGVAEVAWMEPWCKEKRVSLNEMLSVDKLLSATLSGTIEEPQS